MPEWFQVFNADGACVYELLAYTADGALNDARSRGVLGCQSAKRLYPLALTMED